MFILTSLTLPLAAFTAFSRTGVSCLHGPHHGAQKSTSTGWRLDSSMTSLTKVCVVVSLTDASAVAVPLAATCFLMPFRSPAPTAARHRAARSALFARLNGKKAAECNQAFSPRRPPETASIRGWCPVASRNLSRSSPRNRRRAGIHQRMKVEHLMRHHGGIEHHGDAAAVSLMTANGVTEPGSTPRSSRISSARAEREPARGAEQPVQRLQLDRRVFLRHDQKGRALLVAQEQVLGMAAGNRRRAARGLPRR